MSFIWNILSNLSANNSESKQKDDDNEHVTEPPTDTDTSVIRSEIQSTGIPIFCVEDRNYDTFEDAVIILKNFAKDHKFAVKTLRSKKQQCAKGGSYERITMACVHEGVNEGNGGGSTMRIRCNFKVVFTKSSLTNLWKINVQEGGHNHSAPESLTVYPSYRREYIDKNKTIIETMQA